MSCHNPNRTEWDQFKVIHIFEPNSIIKLHKHGFEQNKKSRTVLLKKKEFN